MHKRILGIDIDGVLADFNTAYRAKLLEVTGRDLCPPDVSNPPTWEWPSFYGYTEAEEDMVWEQIEQASLFWEDLRRLPDADIFLHLLASLPQTDDIYFVTSRPGLTAKGQSERWLEMCGYGGATVTIALPSHNKGPLAAALNLTHFIDDKAENCRCVKVSSPETQVFLLRYNYNQAQQAGLRGQGVVVIDSILEFAEAVSDVGD